MDILRIIVIDDPVRDALELAFCEVESLSGDIASFVASPNPPGVATIAEHPPRHSDFESGLQEYREVPGIAKLRAVQEDTLDQHDRVTR